MKIIIEATGTELAGFVRALQTDQLPDGELIKSAIRAAMTKFCDTYDLHDDEIDAALDRLATDEAKHHESHNQQELSETFTSVGPNLYETTQKSPEKEHQKKRRRSSHSIIGKLEPELRKRVNNMLLSDHTYGEIQQFLATHGIAISLSSIQRYNKFLNEHGH